MGGKYSVSAKNYSSFAWQFSLITNDFFKFIGAVIKCAIKYEVIDIGIRKDYREYE